MPTTLKLTKTMLPPDSKSIDNAQFLDVGIVTVQDNGALDIQTTDTILAQFRKEGLRVTASMRGGDVPKSDPDYALAVADSIGRGTLWRYSAAVESRGQMPARYPVPNDDRYEATVTLDCRTLAGSSASPVRRIAAEEAVPFPA